MKITRQNVRYEFFSFETGPTGLFNTTLVLNNPASVKFVLTGTGGAPDYCVINNLYNLQPIGSAIIPPVYPFELILNNNINEIDTTVYTVRILSPGNSIQLKIVVKYLVQ